ncbi:hypothetical protein RHGRI_011134 [Rhododendron griersonianum]|uniref:BED-type domain-containing protein n=1 Tax=Rhododendron griersonianum TaxID=479676 RepID=A0AAV6KKR5_9ERIC|nr:hypothetical protein RHGRI_011134 [Rhododendron griersonianum]
MDPDFDFFPSGELEDDAVDEVDEVEVELGGNSNPLVSTNADFVDIQDDTVVEVEENRLKRKLPPQVPKPKKERYRSPAWDHFNEIKEGGVTKWAECKYCKKQYKAESKKHGVSNLKAHIPVFPLYPNRDQHGQQNISFKPADGGGVDVVTHVFSFDDCKRALAEMVIIDELPIRVVEGIGFRKFWKEVAEGMEKRVKGVLDKLYDAYANDGEVRVQVASATPSVVMDEDCDDRLTLASEFDTYLEQEYSSVCSLEVDKYLNDLYERKDIPDFDVLLWWKNNSNKYPILSQLAHDVLAMPVSTVASKSAFSTGGRVLDPFRSSLSPSMVETLVCTQNWLLSTVPISLRQAMDKVEDLEREILENDASSEVPKN